MFKFIQLLLLLLLISCSFKSKDGSNDRKSKNGDALNAGDLRSLDSDGDRIDDFTEQERGLDRFVANFPEIKVNFLQNYQINLHFEDETIFTIDTAIRNTNPDFKYRVGNLFLKENCLDNAAKIGRFSGNSWGKIEQQDFSWVKYPDIDKEFFHSKVKEYQQYSSKKLVETRIDLENSLKLVESGLYSAIEKLELNFYYYSYEKESYVLLKTEQIDRTFQAGVRETFHVAITNPPEEMLEDTYLRHGKFIISEVKDFFIPELNTKYSSLLKSVKSKSIPVYKTTPYESNMQYVAVPQEGLEFISIMSRLFAEKFVVRENQLTKLEQFENNLRNFNYLHELRGVDKEGRWYVMTNKLKKHYLKHSFDRGDSITLSYITGNELAQRASETIFASSQGVYSGSSSKKYVLGNISRNSRIDFSVYLEALKGREVIAKPGAFSFRPPSCRNCTGNDWSVHANFTINSFQDFEKDWIVSSISEIGNSIELEINNNVLDLEKLINEGLATYELKTDENGQYIHFRLDELHDLDVIHSGKANVASLTLSPVNVGLAGRGLRLDSVGGSNIDRVYHGGFIAFKEAGRRKVPIAVTGWKFDVWQKKVPWGVLMADGYTPTKGQKEKYWNGIVVGIVSNITNYFN